jgi:hypothetical protein
MISKLITSTLSAFMIFLGISTASVIPLENKADEQSTNNISANLIMNLHQRISSAEDLEYYKKISIDNSKVVIRDYKDMEVPFTISLKKPITFEEFKVFVTDHSLKVNHFKIRGIDEYNTRTTTFGAPSETELVPMDMLEIMSQGTNRKILGIVAFDGTIQVNEDNISKLQANDSVYILSLDSILLTSKNPLIKKPYAVDDVYWEVEDYLNK